MSSSWVNIISDELVAFCVDSGIHILDRCINDGDGETESAECISDAMDVSFNLLTIVLIMTLTMLVMQSVAVSPPMAACVCQALHDSFTSLFTTTHLLCSRSLIDLGGSFILTIVLLSVM